MKLQDMKKQDTKITDIKVTDEVAGYEIARETTKVLYKSSHRPHTFAKENWAIFYPAFDCLSLFVSVLATSRKTSD